MEEMSAAAEAATAAAQHTRKMSQSSLNRTKQEEDQGHAAEPGPILSKADVAKFRNPYMQNICVALLQEGYHRSFSEIFFLVKTNRERRALEPIAIVRHQTPLEEQPAKLETMKLHLSWAEQAERQESWMMVCEQRLFLGQFFSAPEDHWLSFHFYSSCLEKEQEGCTRPAIEARACMAKLLLLQGELEQAKLQAELCIEQATESGLLDVTGRPLRFRAYKTLWQIHSQLADISLEAQDYSEALTLLLEGYSMATESEDKQVEGEAAYQLGVTYQRAGDTDTAKQYFNTCMQICMLLQDADGLGRSYYAMTKCLESEGNVEETVQYLEMLADVSRSHGLEHNLPDAYLCLGNIYYAKKNFDKACEYFLQAYYTACNLEEEDVVQKAQVLVGCARAKLLIRTYSADVESATPDALERLLAWKDRRIHHEIEDESAEEYKSFKPVLADLLDRGLGDDNENGDDGDDDDDDDDNLIG